MARISAKAARLVANIHGVGRATKSAYLLSALCFCLCCWWWVCGHSAYWIISNMSMFAIQEHDLLSSTPSWEPTAARSITMEPSAEYC